MMPIPRTPDAPKWSSSAPEELDDFLWLLEQMFAKEGITDDKEKIRWAAMYPDKEDAADWRGLKEYEGSSWQEFKQRLAEEYCEDRPLKRIKDLSRAFKPIGIDDEQGLRVFVRKFRAEARKCMEGPSALMSHWGAVELFKETLTKEFRDALLVPMAIAERSADSLGEPLNLETAMKLAVDIATRGALGNEFQGVTRGGRKTTVKVGDVGSKAGVSKEEFLQFKEGVNARLAAMEERITNQERKLASLFEVDGKNYVGATGHQPRDWREGQGSGRRR